MIRRYASRIFNLAEDSLYRFRLAGHNCLPHFFKRPYPRRRLQEVRHSDSQLNAEHSPPTDEHIDLCSVWAVEFYTPTHIDELLRRLERLGWTGDISRNPASWIKNRVASQFGQAWMRLGLIVPQDDPNQYVIPPLRVDLPTNVKYAYGDIFCFTPSLIAIAIEFIFDEEYSHILDDGLRQERQSYVTAIPTGYRIHDPGTQRTAYVKELRRKMARHIAGWFSNNMPGLCADGLLEGDLATCEFVILRKAQPFPSRNENDGNFQWYLHHLGLANGFDSWRDKSTPSLRFNPSSNSRYIPKYHSILAMNEHGWKEQVTEENHDNNKGSITYMMHERISGLVGIWAVGVLLQGYARHFQELRQADFLSSARHKAKVETLQKIGEGVSYGAEIATVTFELASFADRKRPLFFGIPDFVPSPDVPETWRAKRLEQLIREQIRSNAKWLGSIESAVRDHLTQYGTIVGMVEDIRIQKKITWLTYVLLFLTVVLAILTLVTSSQHFPWLQKILEPLGYVS